MACLARSRRDSLNPCVPVGLDAVEDNVVMEAWESKVSKVSADAKEKPELEERELERE